MYKVPDMRATSLLLASVGLTVLVAPAQAQLLTVDHPGHTPRKTSPGAACSTTRIVFSATAGTAIRFPASISGAVCSAARSPMKTWRRPSRAGRRAGCRRSSWIPPELTGIVAFIRAGFDTSASVRVGDAARGRAVFQGKGECVTCHRVAGKGPRSAPDLSDIGIARAPAMLERSVRDPSSALLPINRPVRIVMRDGRTIRGRRLNEDTHTVQIIDDKERLLSVLKKDVRSFDVVTESPMPAYAAKLSATRLPMSSRIC